MSGKSNRNLIEAKLNQDDEYYTQYDDVEKELENYKSHFVGKTVYCNCDGSESNFVKYFNNNFQTLQLKDSFYSSKDFRGHKSTELLKMSDIVVTNPPFSLFRTYVEQLVKYNKKFLIIGPLLASKYKNIMPLMMAGEIWFGCGTVSCFTRPDGSVASLGNTCWYTNLEPDTTVKRTLPLCRNYVGNEHLYPKYDNFDAIEVSRVADLPKGFQGVACVPISYMPKHDPDRYEILGKKDNLYLNGKKKFSRILIREKAA